MEDFEFAVIFPPNHPLSNTDRQKPVIYDENLFVDINSKGNTIVGSSSLTDTYWESTFYYYDSTKAANQNEPSCYFQLPSTVGVATFFTDNKILLAEDYLPALKLLLISDENTNAPVSITSAHTEEIPHRITALSLWKHTTKAISSAGNTICIWSVQNGAALTQLNQYANCHTDIVNDVDSCKCHEHIFASVSSDRRACLWDIRNNEQPAKIYENEFSSLTTVAFDPSNEHLNYYGSEVGDVYTVDVRKPGDFLAVTRCFDSYGVFKMIANNNTENGVMLAVCGDGADIKVFNAQINGDLKVKYVHSGDNESSIVRDVAWSPDDVLYSCGFNRKFSQHFMR